MLETTITACATFVAGAVMAGIAATLYLRWTVDVEAMSKEAQKGAREELARHRRKQAKRTMRIPANWRCAP